ncbi:MAG: hypothetical protein J6M05_06495 [Cardiobacteriaceae bacterium]|nr:hypothetical protein [Cardiobacteriaceae bacterium]
MSDDKENTDDEEKEESWFSIIFWLVFSLFGLVITLKQSGLIDRLVTEYKLRNGIAIDPVGDYFKKKKRLEEKRLKKQQ